MHYFCIEISNIFWGEVYALFPDPTPYPSAPYFKFLDPSLLKALNPVA